MHATRPRPRARRLRPRVGVAVLALLGWLGAQAAAIAHVAGADGNCAHDGSRAHGGGCAHAPAARSCGHDHAHRSAADPHDEDESAPTPSPDGGGGDRAPGHDADGCALCAHAATVVDRAAPFAELPPVGAAVARAGVRPPSVRPSPRFEPGLARGPPAPARS